MTSDRWSRLASLVLSALAVAVLQGLLTVLWPERPTVGLTMPLDPRLDRPDRIPTLGHIVVQAWILISGAALIVRMLEDHPRAIAGLQVDTDSAARLGRSLVVLTMVYGLIGIAGAIIEHLFVFHFQTTIAHYVVIATVIAGVFFSGRRRPFLSVSLAPPTDPEGRTRRRNANALAVTLLALLYVCWTQYERLWTITYEMGAIENALIDLANVPLGFVLGWALVHSSAAEWSGRAIRSLEARAQTSDSTGGAPRVAMEWLAHVGIAGLLLAGCRAFWVAARELWTTGRWIVQHEPDQRLLGVDWYWASVWEGVTAAEVLLLPTVALLVGVGTHRRLTAAR
ncbi:MAG: hypothetical protein AAGE94_23505 [Acidobacteriota bacterium]